MEWMSIGRAARVLGVAISTLRRWHLDGTFIPEACTPGGHRRYSRAQLDALRPSAADAADPRITLAYARVSSHDQKQDLETQAARLRQHCLAAYNEGEVIQDLGSGLNYRKPGFRRLLRLITQGRVRRLVITHKDRLLRFGAEIVFWLCEQHGTEVVILEQTDASFEQTLAADVIELMTVFSARLHGSRSRRNLKAAINSA